MTITTAAKVANRRANTPILLTLALVGAMVGAVGSYKIMHRQMSPAAQSVVTFAYIAKHNLARTPLSAQEWRQRRDHAFANAPQLAARFDLYPGVVGTSALTVAFLLPVFVSGVVAAARKAREEKARERERKNFSASK